MKGLVGRRQRVLRVRHVQHAMAVAEAARARDEAAGIAHNIERLARVRCYVVATGGLPPGASWAAWLNLAPGLYAGGRQLDGALYDANRKVETKEGLTLAANREKEIATRLKDRARAELEEWRENKLAALPRYRRMQRSGEA
jgi:hypothetical protein